MADKKRKLHQWLRKVVERLLFLSPLRQKLPSSTKNPVIGRPFLSSFKTKWSSDSSKKRVVEKDGFSEYKWRLIFFLILFCNLQNLMAQGIEVTANPSAVVGEDALMVTAQFKINLTPVLEDALQKGIPLYFVREFELSRSRWYWLSESVTKSSQIWRLDYHALTQQYRISSGLFHQNVNTLEDALRLLQRVYSWKVAERHDISKGTYEARVRLAFDPSRLPLPLQLNILNQKEWTLSSEWKQWQVTF